MINYILSLILLILLIIHIYKQIHIIEGKDKKKDKGPNINNVTKQVKNVTKQAQNVVASIPPPSWPPMPPPPVINRTICSPPRENDGEDDWCKRKLDQIQVMTNKRNILNQEVSTLEETQRQQISHIKTLEGNINDLNHKSNTIRQKTEQVNLEIENANELNRSLYEHKNYVFFQLKKKSKDGAFKDISITNIYA